MRHDHHGGPEARSPLGRRRPQARRPPPRGLPDAGTESPGGRQLIQSPTYGTWIQERLAEFEAHYSTDPPIRTDEGDTAAPFLAAVYTDRERSILTHREMKEFLVERFGLRCWGCDFTAPDERYLQLDHADPKKDGGSNELDNRTLLCQPCNLAKSNRITLGQLRRENIRTGYLTKPTGTKRGQDGHPIDLPTARRQCREALDRQRAGQSLQLQMML